MQLRVPAREDTGPPVFRSPEGPSPDGPELATAAP